jgi:hypothetical protein
LISTTFSHSFIRLLLRRVLLRGDGVVARGSVGCSVVLRRFGVVGMGSIRSRVVFLCLSGVVIGSLGAVLRLFSDAALSRVILRDLRRRRCGLVSTISWKHR